MRVLLDTHVWLWKWGEPERLRNEARTIVEDPATELNVSAVSAWEIAAKHAAGRLRLPSSPEAWLTDPRHRRDVTELPITFEHAIRAGHASITGRQNSSALTRKQVCSTWCQRSDSSARS